MKRKSESKEQCSNCKQGYRVVEEIQISREKGKFECEKCDHLIKEWNGAVDYIFYKI